MKNKTYRNINLTILLLFCLTFFFQTFPYYVSTSQPENPQNTFKEWVSERIGWTSGLYQLQVNEYGDFLLMNSIFVLFFVGNKLFYQVDKTRDGFNN